MSIRFLASLINVEFATLFLNVFFLLFYFEILYMFTLLKIVFFLYQKHEIMQRSYPSLLDICMHFFNKFFIGINISIKEL